jgi:hypothetical protein
MFFVISPTIFSNQQAYQVNNKSRNTATTTTVVFSLFCWSLFKVLGARTSQRTKSRAGRVFSGALTMTTSDDFDFDLSFSTVFMPSFRF